MLQNGGFPGLKSKESRGGGVPAPIYREAGPRVPGALRTPLRRRHTHLPGPQFPASHSVTANRAECMEGNRRGQAKEHGAGLKNMITREDEAPHTRDEAREEGVEGEGPHEEAVTELQRPGQQYVQEVRVQQLQALRSGAQVLFQEARNDRHHRRRHDCTVASWAASLKLLADRPPDRMWCLRLRPAPPSPIG